MKERNFGIDLLRLILMYMVCIIHVLGQGGILSIMPRGTTNYVTCWFLQSIACCAVDGFALITGYTANNCGQKYEKIVNMWFQVFFYSFILTAIMQALGLANVGYKMLIKQMLPITFDTHWYFSAYVGLFFAIPLLNSYIFSVRPEKAKRTLIMLIVLFCFLGMIKDSFKAEYGYSMLWLIILYIIGALVKKLQLFENIKTSVIFFILIACILINLLLVVLTGLGRQTKYTSPTVLCTALCLVILFTRLKLSKKWIWLIKHTSRWAFGIYLFQVNYVIWNQYLYNRFVSFAKENTLNGCLYIILAAGAIFLIGLFVEAIRDFLYQRFQIPRLCGIIVNKIQIIIGKLATLLK